VRARVFVTYAKRCARGAHSFWPVYHGGEGDEMWPARCVTCGDPIPEAPAELTVAQCQTCGGILCPSCESEAHPRLQFSRQWTALGVERLASWRDELGLVSPKDKAASAKLAKRYRAWLAREERTQ